jgi:signal transduction histidine kinase
VGSPNPKGSLTPDLTQVPRVEVGADRHRPVIRLNAFMRSDVDLSPEWLEAANLHATVSRQLSMLIHQMNNTLQTISGHAELLASDPGVGEQTIRRASVISAVADRSAKLLASFQVFTHPLEGAVRQNVREVASQALAFRQYGLGRSEIQATVEGVEDGYVRTEPRALMQALTNVIMNAEQALTARGSGGRIVVTVSRAGSMVNVVVQDNGPGLPPDGVGQQPRIGPHHRLGIGLATARRIVERFGGTSAVSPAAAGGTTVTLALPADR